MYYFALIIIVLIFIWRVAIGFRKGMVQEVISLIAMAVAGVCVVLILGAIGNREGNPDGFGSLCSVPCLSFGACIIYLIRAGVKASDHKRPG